MEVKIKANTKRELERLVHEAQVAGYKVVGSIYFDSFGQLVQRAVK